MSLSSIGATCQVRMNRRYHVAIKNARSIRSVIEANHRNVNIRTIENPVSVADSKENIAGLLNTLKYLPICPTSDTLRRQQPHPLRDPLFDHGSGLLEPVAAEVTKVWY